MLLEEVAGLFKILFLKKAAVGAAPECGPNPGAEPVADRIPDDCRGNHRRKQNINIQISLRSQQPGSKEKGAARQVHGKEEPRLRHDNCENPRIPEDFDNLGQINAKKHEPLV